MKIGEFAKKYHMNPSAVRYYIEKALLSPKRENGQYSFDQSCMEQMDRIMRYKKCRFSLEEIEVLSYFEGTTNLKDEAILQEFLQMYYEKAASIKQKIKELDAILQYIQQDIEHYQKKAETVQPQKSAYVSLEVLELLHCPLCQKRLSLKDADIESRGIFKGDLLCDCGYHAVISDGMVLCEGAAEDTPFKVFDNVDSVLSITDDFSPAYRNLMEKGHLWMYQQISSGEKHFHTMMMGPFSYNFLLKHIKTLPEDCLYIIIDVSTKKLEKLKGYFGESNRKIVYMAGKLEQIPIKKESIDVYIDDFSITNHIFTYNQNPIEVIGTLIKPYGLLLGVRSDYTHAPQSLENFKKDHDGFNPELMKRKKIYRDFAKAGFKIVEENNFGFPQGNQQDFLRNVSGEKVSVIACCAEKGPDKPNS